MAFLTSKYPEVVVVLCVQILELFLLGEELQRFSKVVKNAYMFLAPQLLLHLLYLVLNLLLLL